MSSAESVLSFFILLKAVQMLNLVWDLLPHHTMNVKEILNQHFGLEGFRRGQEEIISAVLAKKDVLAVLPTGGGKSLCYQLPAIAAQKLVVVISPLIALMEDQVSALKQKGIPAGCLHSGQTEDEKKLVFQAIAKGGAFLLYLSPERVQKSGFQTWIKDKALALFAVDEAHCVSQWGHDFREEYGQLKILKNLRPDVPVLALTASATPLVLSDVSHNLGLQKPERHVHGFYRKNLYYQVEACIDEEDKQALLTQALEQTPTGRVLIYCGTRKSTEAVAKQLGKLFEGVGYYHAGLSSEERSEMQESYAKGSIRILAATNAFGMGIDHPDVRLVIHFQMPANIDSLYQEMGRAGRDGFDSTCLLLYAKKDKSLQSYFIRQSEAPPAIKSSRWNTLEALVNYAEGGECRHGEILTYYRDSQRIDHCGHCDVCAPAIDRRIERPIFAQAAAVRTARTKKKAKKSAITVDVLSGVEKIRFDALKSWRWQKAKELDVAAFMIFSDKTLRQLAHTNPQTTEALAEVYGLGESKIAAFGQDVLRELQGAV